MRTGTASAYDRTLNNLTERQSALSQLQTKISAGKQVLKPSDDPVAAAQAERALTRQGRLSFDQRALANQRDAIHLAESSLGDSVSLMQQARELVLSAGNTTYTANDRNSMAQQLAGIRDQLLALANSRDSNGNALFSGLGSPGAAFTDSASGVQFNGTSGQLAAGQQQIPNVMDGQAIWSNIGAGNGVFTINSNSANTGTAWADVGQIGNPSALTGHNYQVNFSTSAAGTTYSVTDTTSNTTVTPATSYVSGQAIAFDGLSFHVTGTPQNGDSLQLAPSTRTDIFSTLDQAIQGIRGASSNSPGLMHAVQQGLAQLDTGLERLQSARGQAGDWLNRADQIDQDQQKRSIQLEADRSRAEDLDMLQGLSDLQTQQTAYEAALKSYAQVQRLSLFNFING